MVIFSDGVGWDLEFLAGGRVSWDSGVISHVAIQALSWIAFLIAIARGEGQTWFLMLVGGLGTVQNIVVAGSRRPPSAFGIYLKERKTIRRDKVREALFEANEEDRSLGPALFPIFFPGPMESGDAAIFGTSTTEQDADGNNAVAQDTTIQATEAEGASSTGRVGAETESSSLESRLPHQHGES